MFVETVGNQHSEIVTEHCLCTELLISYLNSFLQVVIVLIY